MIGHIYDGRLIRFCFIADIDGIIVRQFHQNFTGNVARETFFTVRSDISQFDLLRIQLHSVEHTILKPFRATMQAMAVVILRQLIFNAVQCEFTLIDTISITTDAGTKIRRFADIILNRIESQNYILHLSVFIGNHHRNNTSSEIRHADFHVILVAKGV